MRKTVIGVLVGLAAGFVAAHWISPGGTPSGELDAPDPATKSSPSRGSADGGRGASPARVAELESALKLEIDRRVALEQRVDELGAALEELRDAGARAAAAPGRATEARNGERAGDGPPDVGRAFRGRETTEQRVDRLVGAGFPPDRAAWIEQRLSELAMQRIEADYRRRRGEDVSPELTRPADRVLREELGDDEYERYLAALGRPTDVGVFNVIPRSPAEQAGLREGDRILSYAGTRVFDVRELNALTAEGTPGEPVVLKIDRAGQPLDIVLPRGPIGIGGGPFDRRR